MTGDLLDPVVIQARRPVPTQELLDPATDIRRGDDGDEDVVDDVGAHRNLLAAVTLERILLEALVDLEEAECGDGEPEGDVEQANGRLPRESRQAGGRERVRLGLVGRRAEDDLDENEDQEGDSDPAENDFKQDVIITN